MSLLPPHAPRRLLDGLLATALLGGSALLLGPAATAGAAPTQDPAATTTVPPGTEPSETTTGAAGVDDGDPGCGDVVHDPAGRLAPGTDLAPAAVRLVAAGVDVRVRVGDELPGVDEVEELSHGCPGWRVDDQRPGRSAWLFVAPDDRAASLWYGAELRSRLGARFPALLEAATGGGSPFDGATVARLLDGVAALAAAEPPEDPFGCQALLWDPTDQLAGGSEAEDVAFALQGEGADVHVRVEGASDGDIDRRIEQLDEVCGWANVGSDRPAEQLVVIVQPSQRSTGIWYGTDWDRRLEGRWDDIQERAMNPEFRRGDYDGGLAAGLRQVGEDAPYLPGLPHDPDRSDDDADGFGLGSFDTGSTPERTFPWGPIVLVGLVAVVAWGLQYASWRSKVASGETDLSFGQYAGSGRGGYRRSGSRSFRSSSSSGGRRRSSGGGRRRSSGGGGRRSGGGSTRW